MFTYYKVHPFKAENSVVFSVFTRRTVITTNYRTFLSLRNEMWYPLVVTPNIPLFPSLVPVNLLPVSRDLPIPNLLYNLNHTIYDISYTCHNVSRVYPCCSLAQCFIFFMVFSTVWIIPNRINTVDGRFGDFLLWILD